MMMNEFIERTGIAPLSGGKINVFPHSPCNNQNQPSDDCVRV